LYNVIIIIINLHKALNTKQLTEEGASKPIHAVPPSKASKFAPYHFEDDTGSNNSGFYDLIGVLTHQGRSSSSGHYVSWIKRTTNQWFKYDDDDVTMVTDEDIKKLSGGGKQSVDHSLLTYNPQVTGTLLTYCFSIKLI
jgi:ubiquitin carboxyl-terminal hydrolase 14